MAHRTHVIALIFAGLSAAIDAPTATAQPGTTPPTPAPAPTPEQLALGIRIDGSAAEVDAGAVRNAIAAELDVAVSEATVQQPALGVVTVTLDRNAARLVYRRVDGVSTERTLTLPSDPAARVQLLAFMVTNLVRDQTSEALAQLSRRPAVTPARDAALPAAAADGADEIAFSVGIAPPLQLDRTSGEHHIVGAGFYLLMGVQDGSKVFSMSGVADYQRRFASGLQLAGAVAVAQRLDGLQLAGAVTVAGEAHGLQFAGGAAIASSLNGMQVAGGANIAGDVRGVQISPINVARHLHGLQFGVFNISDGDDDAVPIGLFNYARHGRTALEASVDSSAMSTLILRHGPRHVHNVWGFGEVQGHARLFAGLGLGAHFAFGGALPVSFDLDAMAWGPLRVNDDNDDLIMINQLRATIGIPVGPVDVIGGAIENVYVEDGRGIFKDLHPHLEQVYTSGTTRVAIWPSGFLGIRLRT